MSERSTTLGKESSKSKSVAGNSHKQTTRKGKKLSQEEIDRKIRRAKIRDELIFMLYLKKKQQLKQQKARA